MQDRTTATHGEDVGGGIAPNVPEDHCSATAHIAPCAAVVVQDGTIPAHGEDIG